jgi:hypothetical protein
MDNIPPTPEQPSLALADLVLLLNLIRVTAERGAIKADELSAVGAVHDKLMKFLEASGALNKSNPQPDNQETATTGES